MNKTSTLLFILFSTLGFSQEYKLEDAQRTRTEFLQALKILELPEGKQMLTNLIFESPNSFPVVSSSNLIFEKLINTDIEDVKGYKALMEIQSISKANTLITLRYILISYLDKNENEWKVFSFRESIDIEKEVVSAKQSLNDNKDSKRRQYRIRNLGYWQIMNGELNGAKETFLRGYEEATATGDSEFEVPTYLILDSIIDINRL